LSLGQEQSLRGRLLSKVYFLPLVSQQRLNIQIFFYKVEVTHAVSQKLGQCSFVGEMHNSH
jgi:hypothetical protein